MNALWISLARWCWRTGRATYVSAATSRRMVANGQHSAGFMILVVILPRVHSVVPGCMCGD
jgi:hypothetical protein